MPGSPAVFGVRHLSPAAAWHLRSFLDQLSPTAVLIEGPVDLASLAPTILDSRTRLPIAALAYTEDLPVRTLLYPLARYSPEYQALRWAEEQGVEFGFIDLPSAVFLGLQDRAGQVAEPEPEHEPEHEPDEPAPDDHAPPPIAPSIYDQVAASAGEPDYETYWERRFEHLRADGSYRGAALALGRELRALELASPSRLAEDLVREAFMRRRIAEFIARGHDPARLAVIVGAFHADVMDLELPAMTDAELDRLPRRSAQLTAMPYSYFRLSSQSGYGAGNHAPAYFELLWEAIEAGQLDGLPADYLSRVVRALRESGTHRSVAEVIEAVRLARALAALKDGHAPALADLRDAAVSVIGKGERSAVAEAMARVEVGTAIGALPPGAAITSIQADFNREIARLKLERYRTTVKQDLELDLREDRHAKTRDAAFRDLERSFFLHRLASLDIGFAGRVEPAVQEAAWKERWQLAWTPESEISLVEAVLLGETIELAAAHRFADRLAAATSIAEAALAIRRACECGLGATIEVARAALQRLAAESCDFVELAHAAHELGRVVRYGDVRRYDPAPLRPLLAELFVQGALAVLPAAGCDAAAAPRACEAMDALDRVALEHDVLVDEALWTSGLRALSDADDKNPLMSGHACAILLERNLIGTEELAREVSRRLSPGIDADLGAGWFEGLARRNRYALLSRLPLWRQLAEYVSALDDDGFRRALVFLRRAFGSFGAQEKRAIADNLAEVWGVSHDALGEALEVPLSAAEKKSLEQLGDHDFGDL